MKVVLKSRFILVLFVAGLFILGCSKEDPSQIHAEIIGFDARKCCCCCWGWIIKTENGIIKSDNLPHSERIGYDIKSPIPVILELGNRERECPNDGYDYYEIISLKVVK